MNWIDVVVKILQDLGGKASLKKIYEVYSSMEDSHESKDYEATIRQTIYDHSSDSMSFRSEKDIFCKIEEGVWGLRKEPSNFNLKNQYIRKFIETTSDIDNHGGRGWEYGTCLWSPIVDKGGKKRYELMHEPRENDLVIHFYKEGGKRFFHGYSYVKKTCYQTNDKPTYSAWNWSESFYRIDLKNFVKNETPILLSVFTDIYDLDLRHEISVNNPKNYPFNVKRFKHQKFKKDSQVELKNGQYLTECSDQLFALLQEIEHIEIQNTDLRNKKLGTLANEEYIEAKRMKYESTFFARNPKLKKDAIKLYGYDCQACSFSFKDRYGNFGADYIECHHENPLSERPDKDLLDDFKTSIKDVKLLCSNCHRMIHHKRPALSFNELIRKLRD